MRRIRKIVTYACTTCFALFSSSKMAKEHAKTHPLPPRAPPAGRKGPRKTQTGAILAAIGEGAKTAEAIAKKTRIPLERVHSLLSYHRSKGNVKGFTGDLRLSK